MPLNQSAHSPQKTDAGGCLYVVATPIGNLDDITLRALRILGQVDLVAAEDTRHTRKLLSAHGIKANLVSYHEHNEDKRTPELLTKLRNGENIALVSNAGTPVVSDPGYRLVRSAVDSDIPVVPIPGPSAAVTALSASGMATDQFTFVGFPARKKNKLRQQLAELATATGTLIFYQSPHRMTGFLQELIDQLGDRRAMLARELTKIHEELLHGRLSEIRENLGRREAIKGECTLLVAPEQQAQSVPQEEIESAVLGELASAQKSVSDIAKTIARQFGLKRADAYQLIMALRERK